MRRILIGAVIVAVFFGGTLWALNAFWPARMGDHRPALAALPPLLQVARTSQVVAPVAVALNAIRDTMDAAAPRDLTGKRDNPLTDLLGKADIGWSIGRGPMTVVGQPPEAIAISTALNGTLRVTGQIAGVAGGLTGSISGLLGGSIGRNVGNLTARALDQRADIRGSVQMTARPTIQQNWRIEPNLTGQVAIADGGLTIAGFKLNLANEVKPLIDRTVSGQMAALSNRLRNDPTLERTARREWATLCRSIPLGAAGAGAPDLWLELRPTRAFAAQPRITADWAILTLGMQAETRILPSQTKPDCPFPSQLEIVPAMEQGRVAIAVPVDVPFTAVTKLLEAQLKGKTFPDDPNAAVTVNVHRVSVAASGDRLLISLRVKANERKSWFGFGAEATVHVWGKPALDRERQILRMAELELDVESEAAFGLLGVAAQAARPQLRAALEQSAAIDLKPFAASARAAIQSAVSDLQSQSDGVRVESEITDLRLVGIEFDSKTLRVVAEAEGTARALLTKIAVQ